MDDIIKDGVFEKENLTILLVDDNTANLELLISCLKKGNYKTPVAKNGKTALKRAEYLIPDLIILDIQMPGMDGYETCRELKMNEITRDIPVIFMSAFTDTADKQKGLDVGGVDYITKPFNSAEVLVRVDTHLTIHVLQKKLNDANHQLDSAQKLVHELKCKLKGNDD